MHVCVCIHVVCVWVHVCLCIVTMYALLLKILSSHWTHISEVQWQCNTCWHSSVSYLSSFRLMYDVTTKSTFPCRMNLLLASTSGTDTVRAISKTWIKALSVLNPLSWNLKRKHHHVSKASLSSNVKHRHNFHIYVKSIALKCEAPSQTCWILLLET